MSESVFVPPEFAGSQSMPLPRIVRRGDLADEPCVDVPDVFRGNIDNILVALDVDGTLVSHQGELDCELLEGLHRLESAGAHIVVATGRSIPAVMPIVSTLNLSGDWAICSNGAVTIRTAHSDAVKDRHDYTCQENFCYTVTDRVTFDPTEAIHLLSQALPGALIGVEAIGRGFRVSEPFPEGELIGEQIVQTLEELTSEPVSRVIVRAPHMNRDDFAHAVSQAGLHSIPWDIGWTSWLDVSPPQTTKASALHKLATQLGVPQQRCVAIGDGSNDKSMIQWAGWGVAMGQADDDVKEVADTISTSVEDGGARRIIEALLKVSSIL